MLRWKALPLSAEKEDFQKNTVIWRQNVPSIGQISVSLLETLCDTEQEVNVTINKDEVGILTENITANISVLQNLKFCEPPVKKYVVLGGNMEV
jgi:hypothetical protein